MIYYNGEFVKQDIYKAKKYWQTSADQNNSKGQYLLGKFYSKKGEKQFDKELSIHYLELSAKNNNEFAQNDLGLLYYNKDKKSENVDDQIVKQDMTKAITYLTLSADQNNQLSQFILANIYFEGEFVQQDYKKAIYYFKEASSLNNKHAKNNLGICYKEGFGVEKNIINSIIYFKEGIALKDKYSNYNYSRLLYFGIGVEENINESIKYLELSSNRNVILAHFFLFLIFSTNNQVKNPNKAEYFYHILKQSLPEFNELNSLLLNEESDKNPFDFFYHYNLVYKSKITFVSDFFNFMYDNKYEIQKEEEHEQNNSTNYKKRMNINNDFYEGFFLNLSYTI